MKTYKIFYLNNVFLVRLAKCGASCKFHSVCLNMYTISSWFVQVCLLRDVYGHKPYEFCFPPDTSS